jgi:putative tryptophan/tyrosine transport system substrate-binding protein
MKNQKLIVGIVIAAVVVLAAVHFSRREKPAAQPESRHVAIVNLGSHPLMDTVTEGCRETLEQEKSIAITPKVFDANFEQELLRRFARQAVSGDFDVLVAVTTPAAQMLIAENAGRKPLVFTFVSTPSAIGWTGPGSLPNVTGFADTVPLKQNLQLIARLVGADATIGYVVNDGEASAAQTCKDATALAEGMGLKVLKIPVGSAQDVRSVSEAAADKVDCFMVGPDSVVTSAIDALLGVAYPRTLPVFCTDPVTVERGALAAVAPDYNGLGQRTAEYVVALLNGTPAKELPVVDFSDYATLINRGTVKRLGLKIPDDILKTAVLVGGNE